MRIIQRTLGLGRRCVFNRGTALRSTNVSAWLLGCALVFSCVLPSLDTDRGSRETGTAKAAGQAGSSQVGKPSTNTSGHGGEGTVNDGGASGNNSETGDSGEAAISDDGAAGEFGDAGGIGTGGGNSTGGKPWDAGTSGDADAGMSTMSGGSTGEGGSVSESGGADNTAGGSTAGSDSGTASCAGTVPPGAYLTDFSDYDPNAHSGDGGWGNTAMGMTGGLFEFGGITTAVADAALTASGNVSDYGAGFGMWFLTCTDASAYSGITFTLAGDPGPDGITVKVQTFSNSPEEGAGCTPTDPAAPWESCALPAKTGVMPGTVTLTWADFTGGLPTPSVTPNQVLGIRWEFAWSDSATAYDVDVTIDDVAFAP